MRLGAIMRKKKEELLKEALSEAEYFNKEYAEDDAKQGADNYLVPDKIIHQVINPDPSSLKEFDYAYSLLGNLENKRLLDFGAGDGWNTICFAKAQAIVYAIDISEKGVELIRKKAKANGVSELVTAEVQNCYNTTYPANSFDIIYGGGILHHLDVDAAGQELSRLLHPEGVAIFFEPMRDTKIMDFFKTIVLFFTRRKASEVTENESPLNCKRIQLLRRYFKVVNYRYFNVLASAGLLTNSETIKRILRHADHILMKYVPGFKKLGRAVVIELRQPTNRQLMDQ